MSTYLDFMLKIEQYIKVAFLPNQAMLYQIDAELNAFNRKKSIITLKVYRNLTQAASIS